MFSLKDQSSLETDDRKLMKRKCFVIMPFGEKIDTGALASSIAASVSAGLAPVSITPGSNVPTINFNKIYDEIIEPAIKEAERISGVGIQYIRSDKIERSGFIHREMLEHVAGDDLAIVDITTQNANVFYELGVRHSYRRSTTILIRREGTSIPFNISGMRTFSYDEDDSLANGRTISARQESINHLAHTIAASLDQKDNDSLVHNLLPETSVVRESWPLMARRYVWYDVLDPKKKAAPLQGRDSIGKPFTRSIGFITGDILRIKDIDVWVNPENNKMQMARFHDGSVSSNIRYYGAKRSASGQVEEDTIADALKAAVGVDGSVEPGVVIATQSGSLAERNNVKLLLHVAALRGEPGKGYQPIVDYPGCVFSVLAEIDRLNALPRHAAMPATPPVPFARMRRPVPAPPGLTGLGCRTVLFPLFGTRSFGHHPQAVTDKLFEAAIVYLCQHPDSLIEDVFFLAYTQQDRDLCERTLGHFSADGVLSPSGKNDV